ncbi:ATP-dependent zinc metalloprotease FtsH [[Mycoplasma] anseris]|uniref:ATP-dependent zinc metalloprotease FtsH n=1 Tax=[Mycoplasma] anseris TaxID=92400 RepID=A0A2Z4ND55_9BACT|nr:ATP-dependent zinc metalloprotease FtsH [[Mycoplasma] anseris]AWX69490.1 ATP-dependent zinc metalloprotease FtsH [[Mycoplasma] anseris]
MDKKQKKPMSMWKIIIIFLSVLLGIFLIVSLVYYLQNKTGSDEYSITVLNKVLKETATSPGDAIYIRHFEDSPQLSKIYVEYSMTNALWFSTHGINVIQGVDPSKVNVYKETFVLNGYIKEDFYKTLVALSNPNAPKNELASLSVNWDAFTANNEGYKSIIKSGIVAGESYSSFVQRIMSPIITLSIFVLLGIFIYKSVREQMGMMRGGKTGESIAQTITKPNKRFSDVAGNEEVKEEIAEVVDYLKNPKKYSTAGARIPKGILLGGPPGTGKTLLAKATAGEAGVPFLFLSASNFVEMFVGLGAKRVRDLFAEARSKAPAIIFIDELDAIGRARGAGVGGGNDEREQTLNQILVEMDGMQENTGVIIMAATNRTDVLDPALLRPGRFDRTITVGLPDIKEREAILKLHAKGKTISPKIKFSSLARRTPGFSGAQLENVINEATLLSVRERTKWITPSQIDEAIDRVMSGPAKKSRTISKEENIAVAYHEAGHAVVGIKLRHGVKVQKITIVPRGNAGGYNLMLPEEEKYNATKSELLASISSFMGGRVAESIIYGEDNVSTGARDDIAKATKIARRMVTEYGLSSLGPIQYEEDSSNPFLGRDYMKNASFSNKIGHEIDLEIRKIILEAEKQAFDIISQNRELLELIKDALVLNETIVAEQIEYIEKNMQLPPEMLKTKEEIKEDVEPQDFDSLFNEVAGQKIIAEPKYEPKLLKEEAIEEPKSETDNKKEN